MNGEIEKKNNFNKRKKIKIIRTTLKKKYIINLDWTMKLKTNKNYIKRSRKKIKNQKNENQSRKNNHDKLVLNDEIGKKKPLQKGHKKISKEQEPNSKEK